MDIVIWRIRNTGLLGLHSLIHQNNNNMDSTTTSTNNNSNNNNNRQDHTIELESFNTITNQKLNMQI